MNGWNGNNGDVNKIKHTKGSHFDKRVVYDDIMITDVIPGIGITPFLMYLMEETGWY